MQCLTFSINDVNYAVNTKEIIEILPLVKIFSIPNASKRFPGYINYRNEFIPILDIAVFLGYHKAEFLFSTRIIVVNFLKNDGSEILLGVLAENATEILEFDDEKMEKPKIDIVKNPLFANILYKNKKHYHLITFRSLKTLQLES